MRAKLPSSRDLRRTVFAIIQSTAFLMTNSIGYGIFICLIRNLWGSLNFYTASYVPAFLTSLCAIILERPSRHGLLCLYVSNVAIETIFNMLVNRGIVPRPIKNGQVAIFGIGVAALLYYYRSGMLERQNDSIFSILRYVVGDGEQKIAGIATDIPNEAITDASEQSLRPRMPIQPIKDRLRHPTCPHRSSCIYYALGSGVKLFSIGLGIQISMKIIPQLTRIFTKGPGHLIRQIFSMDSIKLAIFLGGFSSLFRVSALLLEISNKYLYEFFWLSFRRHLQTEFKKKFLNTCTF